MRRGFLAVLLAAGTAAAAAPAATAAEEAPAAASSAPAATTPAATAPLAPYAAVRSLQAVQDQVAHGNTAAQNALPALRAHVASVFEAAGPAVWKDPRNAEAAALFLFSAGSPAAVRKATTGADITPEGRSLVDGALAYAEGDDDRARALLGKLDPRAMPRGLGGHLALVLASLYADKDPRKAGDMLDQARLLVPGTLVEEAALRRQIFLLTQPATADRFATLSRQYLRRFHASVFAGNFKARLGSFAVELATAGDVKALAKLDPICGDLPAPEARALYLSTAREALLRGRGETARFAASRAAGFAPDRTDAARAKLYAAAAGAMTQDAASAVGALKAIDAAALGPDDAALRTAALAVAGSVDAATNPDAGRSGTAPTPAGASADKDATDLIAKTTQALAAADALLKSAP